MRTQSILLVSILLACSQSDVVRPSRTATTPARIVAKSGPPEAAKAPEPPRDTALDWLRSKLPQGGTAERDSQGKLVVTHKAGPRDTIFSLAKEYIEVSSVYMAGDFAAHIQKANGAYVANKVVTIPDIVQTPYGTPDEERLAWPDDKSLRAIYLRGYDALGTWEWTLEHLRVRDMNAVILDGKAYMGEITYPSKVDVAVRTGAINGAPLTDLARTIRFAHKYGVRVIMRVSCFHDPWAAEKAPELSVRGKWGGPYPIGWLDPGGEAAQKYIADLVEEEVELGADEINLDYVRYPAQKGLGNADFHITDEHQGKITVITDFVRKIHAITQAHHVPLSIDIFGVTATGTRIDVEHLGQDIALLSPNVEVLMPMIYPSHYDPGYYGWEIPGNHPEIINIGTRAAIEKAKTGSAVVRPWLQAFMWKSPEYGPKYLAQETVEAKRGGGHGYAMWNPGGYYLDAWNALPAVRR